MKKMDTFELILCKAKSRNAYERYDQGYYFVSQRQHQQAKVYSVKLIGFRKMKTALEPLITQFAGPSIRD